MADAGGDRPTDTGGTIGRICLQVLKDYITKGLEQKNINAPNLEELETEPSSDPDEQQIVHDVGMRLREIGDKVQEDETLQRQLDCLFESMPKIDTIMTVAKVIFGDTKDLNWGRIVAVFYFTLEAVIRAIKYLSKEGLLKWIKDLVVQVTAFVVRHFSNWIASQGGWSSILENYGTSSTTFVTVLAMSAIVGIYIIYMSRTK
ncbi:apoptosis regulator BAX-like [Amphiura filiformis]|uniref:apoptosis regulator BAX-like n=1 Tax=Amphiura filiformis TaxID=82378 RepID=UPI003B20C34B